MIKLKDLIVEKRFGILYHGTEYPINFKNFNLKGNTYLGIYFTSDKNHAKKFGNNIISAYVTLNNPLKLDLDDVSSTQYSTPNNGEIVINNKIVGFYRNLTPDVIDILKKYGYDGIQVKYKNNDTFEIVAFDPTQINII